MGSLSIDGGVCGVGDLGDGMVAPDDDVLHVPDLSSGLVGKLGQSSGRQKATIVEFSAVVAMLQTICDSKLYAPHFFIFLFKIHSTTVCNGVSMV